MQSLSIAKVFIDRKIIFKTRQVASFERGTGKDRKTKNLTISTNINQKKSTTFKILIHFGEGGGVKIKRKQKPISKWVGVQTYLTLLLYCYTFRASNSVGALGVVVGCIPTITSLP